MGFIPRAHQTNHPSAIPKFEERKQELLKTRIQIDKAIWHAQEHMTKGATSSRIRKENVSG